MRSSNSVLGLDLDQFRTGSSESYIQKEILHKLNHKGEHLFTLVLSVTIHGVWFCKPLTATVIDLVLTARFIKHVQSIAMRSLRELGKQYSGQLVS